MKFNENKEKDGNEEDIKPYQVIDRVNINFVDDSPSYPVKTLVFTLILFVIGTVLLIAGLIEEFIGDDASKGMAMWIIGAVTFIPGFYYTALFFKAYRAKTLLERISILKDIPEI